MKRILRMSDRRAASTVEYALVLALIAVVSLAVMMGIGSATDNRLGNINSNLQ